MQRKNEAYSDVFSKENYKLIILDMDGTLYYQRSMQILMCMEMGVFAVMHPFSLWKLKTISVFRKVREQAEFAKASEDGMAVDSEPEADLLEVQYAITAKKMDRSAEEVKQVIEEWMFKRPLKYLRRTCDKKLCDWIAKWKNAGKKVVVYSDYPVAGKCAMLGIRPDAMYSSDEKRIGEMKPSAKGVEVICHDFDVTVAEILIIGDRMNKDGKMAEAAKAEYLIVDKWKILRNRKYK